jgi:hypothetical protein
VTIAHPRFFHKLGIRCSVLACCIAAFPAILFANVGVFTGDGFTIELQHTASVQLVSERVSIQFRPGAQPFNGGVAALDIAVVECDFELRNLSDSALTIQTGFPLNSQFVRGHNIRVALKEQQDVGSYEAEAINEYQFTVSDQERSYRPRYVARDRSHQYEGIFLWTLSFAPAESKRLHVAYTMPVSETLAPTDEPLDYIQWQAFVPPNYAKPWYRLLVGATLEYFQYVTTTGVSWAGTINHADFSANVIEFQHYLLSRGMLDQSIYDSLREDYTSHPREYSSIPIANKVLVKAVVTPGGWTEHDDIMEKRCDDFRPDTNLSFQFWLTGMPSTPDGIDTFIATYFGEKVSPDDISDLWEIYAAFFGIPPRSESVAYFVKYQAWYLPDSSKTVDSLLPYEKHLLNYLADRRKGSNNFKVK